MNRRMILYFVGVILMLEGAFLLLPAAVAPFYGEEGWRWFILTAARP